MNNLIYVLEDNAEILEIITMILEDFRIEGFGTVSEFSAGFSKHSPALCLLDVMLPDGNGLEICQQMKENPTTAHIPVIVMTANSSIDKMREKGTADDYLAKPFDIDDLTQRITNLI
ncbi:response regulator transcription factor [Sphingobacterium gobiense]|uniref:Response regulator n=1 Tax=Sphingobacterium gobiense TaxID=1382456 RepID=A0A2S9JRR8_9SPHI|nr:response regulator [Sphingobacterium gobiense]PRD55997.1 response regulator [Sphingobacterium gobiense]